MPSFTRPESKTRRLVRHLRTSDLPGGHRAAGWSEAGCVRNWRRTGARPGRRTTQARTKGTEYGSPSSAGRPRASDAAEGADHGTITGRKHQMSWRVASSDGRSVLQRGPRAVGDRRAPALAELTLRLHEADNVVIAMRDHRTRNRTHCAPAVRCPSPTPCPRATRSPCATIAEGEPVRKYGQSSAFATAADPAPATTCTPTTSASWPFERDYAFGTDAAATELVPEAARADLPGHRPAGRPGRHPQLHRHPHLGELLGHRRQADRRAGSAVTACSRTSRTSTASSRSPTAPAAAWPPSGDGLRRAAPHPGRLRQAPELRRLPDPRPRLRGQPDRPALVDELEITGHEHAVRR